MAPFVEREWGAKATELMWRVKQLADPDGILGPGVVLNRDPARPPAQPQVHARDRGGRDQVRRMRLLRAGVPVAQRHPDAAAADRAAPRDGAPGSRIRRCVDALEEQFEYDGVQTCAADGTCAVACPVGIDTGKLVKQLRGSVALPARRAGSRSRSRSATRRSSAPRAGVCAPGCWRSGSWAPARSRRSRARCVASAGPRELVPAWPARHAVAGAGGVAGDRARGRGRRLSAGVHQPDLRQPAGARGLTRPLPEALVAVSARAGLPLWIPPDVAGVCCGVPWSSKGYADGHALMAAPGGGRAQALERRRAPAGRDRRELVHARAAR